MGRCGHRPLRTQMEQALDFFTVTAHNELYPDQKRGFPCSAPSTGFASPSSENPSKTCTCACCPRMAKFRSPHRTGSPYRRSTALCAKSAAGLKPGSRDYPSVPPRQIRHLRTARRSISGAKRIRSGWKKPRAEEALCSAGRKSFYIFARKTTRRSGNRF